MGTARTAWHVSFTALVTERAPPGIEVRAEVQLTSEPQRADLLLLRREGEVRRDEEAHVLRGLWPMLAMDSIVEFKSLTRPFRRGDLVRLLGYGAQYHATQIERLRAKSLTLVLIVANVTASLLEEIERMDWSLSPLGSGYSKIEGNVYTSLVAAIDEVADAERDDLLGLFGHHKIRTLEAKRWWEAHMTGRKEDVAMQELEGYSDMTRKLLESLPVEERLAGLGSKDLLARLSPEERLAGLGPEERLTGLTHEQIIVALPTDILRGLSDELLSTLSPEARALIRKRLGR